MTGPTRLFDPIRVILASANHAQDGIDQALAFGLRHSASAGLGVRQGVDWLHDWSVVVSTFGDPGAPAGTIAVIGPTRMRYGHTIPRVRYVASLMDALMLGTGIQSAGR